MSVSSLFRESISFFNLFFFEPLLIAFPIEYAPSPIGPPTNKAAVFLAIAFARGLSAKPSLTLLMAFFPPLYAITPPTVARTSGGGTTSDANVIVPTVLATSPIVLPTLFFEDFSVWLADILSTSFTTLSVIGIFSISVGVATISFS